MLMLNLKRQFFTHYRYKTIFGVRGLISMEAPLYTEVSSFQGVGIEEFLCIQRCHHIRVLE